MAISDQEKTGAIRSAVDFTIMGDNVDDIAAFTLDKYESKNNTTLSFEMRKEANDKIKEVLWKRIEELKRRRLQILAEMFSLAENTLEEVVKKGK